MRSRPFLDESLRLSDEQKTKIDECIAAGKALRTRERWSYENHVNQTRKAIAILDERQQRIWIKLLAPRATSRSQANPRPHKNNRPPLGGSSRFGTTQTTRFAVNT